MRLLYLLATTTGWGGLEKHVFEVAGEMAARGFDVFVLCSNEYLEKCPAKVQLVPFDWSASRNNPMLWQRLRRELNRINADIIHAQADKPVHVLAKAGWPGNAVTLGTVHYVKSSYGIYSRLDAVIAVNRALAREIPNRNVFVVYNGVHLPQLNDAKLAELRLWRQGKPSPVVLAIGRLVPAKGFDILLNAWPESSEATLVILGEGEQRDVLERIVATRRLKNIYLPGMSSNVAEWISAADILMISSRNEGGPYVLSEALILGLPVVSTDVGMVSDFLPASCVVAPCEVGPMRDLLNRVLSDNAYFRKECEKAFLQANEKLTSQAMMDAMEAVYRKVGVR